MKKLNLARWRKIAARVIKNFYITPRHKTAVLVLAGTFVVVSLIVPLAISWTKYRQFQSLKTGSIVNADIRESEQRQRLLWLFGYCRINVKYSYVVNGQLLQDKDQLNCRHLDKIPLGNTIPVYYHPKDPSRSISGFTLATSASEIFGTAFTGILGVVFVTMAFIAYKEGWLRLPEQPESGRPNYPPPDIKNLLDY